MKTIKVSSVCECPFRYTGNEVEPTDDEWTGYPGDELCTLRAEEVNDECQGFRALGCPLADNALVCVVCCS